MGWTDYTLKVNDPRAKLNMEILAPFHWTENRRQAYDSILPMLGLRKGWVGKWNVDFRIRWLIDLILARRPDSHRFMFKLLRRHKRKQQRNGKLRESGRE